MKTILKMSLILSAVVLFWQCEKDSPHVNIPNINFLNALIRLGIDTDGDGKISPSEAAVIRSLDVSGNSISDITGIESFINLDTLYCYFNNLTFLDVSKNMSLVFLE